MLKSNALRHQRIKAGIKSNFKLKLGKNSLKLKGAAKQASRQAAAEAEGKGSASMAGKKKEVGSKRSRAVEGEWANKKGQFEK